MAEKVERRLAAILSADVVGYGRLMGADEEGTLARLAAHRAELIDPLFSDHSGRIVKVMGDGVLVEFASIVDAVRCAAAIQRGMEKRNADEAEARRIVFRIGINLGDIIVEGDDIHGDGVNVAARMEQIAEPGGICISSDAFRLARGKVELGFADLGEQQLKNIAEPVRAYRVLMEAEAAGEVVELQEKKKQAKTGRRWAIPAAAAAVIIAIAAGVLLSLEPWVPRVEAADPAKMAYPLPEKPSLVVLPFENVGGDPAQDFFVDGATSDIIAHLSTRPELFVIDRHSSYAYKHKPVTVKQVAEELGVRYVLQGTVQRAGKSLRITTQLIDALSGETDWSERYDKTSNDLFALQDEITRNVTVALDVELIGGKVRETSLPDLE